MTENIKKIMNINDILSTKKIGKLLGISTKSAYKLCIKAEKEGWLHKYGYRVKDGWEDPEFSNQQTHSLYWQRY